MEISVRSCSRALNVVVPVSENLLWCVCWDTFELSLTDDLCSEEQLLCAHVMRCCSPFAKWSLSYHVSPLPLRVASVVGQLILLGASAHVTSPVEKLGFRPWFWTEWHFTIIKPSNEPFAPLQAWPGATSILLWQRYWMRCGLSLPYTFVPLNLNLGRSE